MSAQPDLRGEFDVKGSVADAERWSRFAGVVDVGTAPILRGAPADVHAHPHRDRAHAPSVVDLAGVTVIDASGLRVLVGAAGRAHREERDLVVLDPSPITVRVLEIARLLDIFLVDWHRKEVTDLRSGEPISRAARNVAWPKTDQYLVVVHGTESDVTVAKQILDDSEARQVDLHASVPTSAARASRDRSTASWTSHRP